MEKISQGKYFEFIYDLSRIDADGTRTLVHQIDREEPEHAIYGLTQGFVPALERALEGLQAGDKFDFVASAEEGFGPYDKDDIVELPRDVFKIDGKFDEEAFVPGAYVPMMTAEGYRIDGLILDVTDKIVVVDFNHPLAKDSVHFAGEVLSVRDATPEELQPSCGCGCGGNCGGGCEGGCDDNGSCGCGGCQ